MAARSRPLGGPCSWSGGHPSPGFGGNKKAAAPGGSCSPGTSSSVPLYLVRLRETSDPILRTAGPPAHTQVPGALGVSHGPRMVGDVPANRQPSYVHAGARLPPLDRRPARLAPMTAIPETFRAFVAEKV